MPCTTVLVGRKASNDGSTMIARTDDGHFDIKKLILTDPKKQPRKYKGVNSHLTIELPEEPLAYTSTPNVDKYDGEWPAQGINSANVGMSATETITTNPRVVGADPFVAYKKAESKKEKDFPGGIGEEDLVILVMPYIKSAKEGVARLGSLLEKYGTYESNGIAFNDEKDIWWMETIGGHHWIAARVPEDRVVIMPNQFGLDHFDFDDALGKQENFMCSADLKEFVEKNGLDLNQGEFNPRWCFGSHSDSDHIYNTPRAWYMGRYFNPTTYKWDGPDADFTPESDNIPWSVVPEKKVTVEDVKYILSSHYQGTPYDVYAKTAEKGGKYRPIAVNRTGVMSVSQIRGGMAKAIQAVQWVCFGSTAFDALVPVYTNVPALPKYLTGVTKDVSTDNFYWTSRLINALADPYYPYSVPTVNGYQSKTMAMARAILNEYDAKYVESGDAALLAEANRKLCDMIQKESTKTLGSVLQTATEHMKNGFNRADN